MEAAFHFGLDCGRSNGNLTPRPTVRLDFIGLSRKAERSAGQAGGICVQQRGSETHAQRSKHKSAGGR